MVLESIHNQIDSSSGVKTTKIHNKQRVISESTGLVKFNLSNRTNSKVKENVKKFSEMNKEFQSLDRNMAKVDFSKDHIIKSPIKSGLNLHSSIYSPKRTPDNTSINQSSPKRRQIPSRESLLNTKNSDDSGELFIQLASKQRQVLDFKTQIEILKAKSKQSEKELHELEKMCGNAITPITPKKEIEIIENPFVSPFNPKSSINQLRNQIESSTSIHQQNFNSLKKKLSLAQLPTSTETFHSLQRNKTKSTINLNENFNKLQNDTKVLLNKSLKFVNNLSKDIHEKLQKDFKYDQFNGDTSDEDEEFESYGMKTRSIFNKNISSRNVQNYYDENDDKEDYEDWSYCEADNSDFMISVK